MIIITLDFINFWTHGTDLLLVGSSENDSFLFKTHSDQLVKTVTTEATVLASFINDEQ